MSGRAVPNPKWYARCNDCGGEVVFDAYATLDGEVWNTFEKDNICTLCDGHQVRWTKTARDDLPPAWEDD